MTQLAISDVQRFKRAALDTVSEFVHIFLRETIVRDVEVLWVFGLAAQNPEKLEAAMLLELCVRDVQLFKLAVLIANVVAKIINASIPKRVVAQVKVSDA